MQRLRTYQIVPALLALSLMLTSAVPLVRHACGMSAMEMAERPCCKSDMSGHDMAAVSGHAASGEMPSKCHDAPTDSSESPCSDTADWLALRAACCSNVEAPAAPAPERVEPFQVSLLTLAVSAFLLPPEPPPSPPRLADASPPAPPAALHLLYGSFLT